jgi:hypothetical protein
VSVVVCFPLSLTLMELLATRLSPHAGKSLDISREGRGDEGWMGGSVVRSPLSLTLPHKGGGDEGDAKTD